MVWFAVRVFCEAKSLLISIRRGPMGMMDQALYGIPSREAARLIEG
jgi:hypothetical protein